VVSNDLGFFVAAERCRSGANAAVGTTNPAIGINPGGVRPLHALVFAVRHILKPGLSNIYQ
jgi:hypothetical protein